MKVTDEEGQPGAEGDDDTSLVRWLKRENEALRREVEALRVYRSLAYRDPLTSLWNRRYLDQRVMHEVDRAKRAPGSVFSILVLDINDFKAINDKHGHAAGDEALIWAASLLEESLRDHDVCCRTGGDEFTVILPGADADGCALLIARFRRRLAEANQARPWPLQVSIGEATWPDDGANSDELLAAADAAMYEDKQRQKHGASLTPRARLSTMQWGGPPAAAKKAE